MRLRWSAAPGGLGHREPHQCSGESPSSHAPGDWPDRRGGPVDAVPDGHPEDDAGHHDPGGRDNESKRLQLVADGRLWDTLFQVAAASLQWAMTKGHTISKTVAYKMAAEVTRLKMEDAEAQRRARDLQAADHG
jgi:hypothetical protein